jgi:hypothetical protein
MGLRQGRILVYYSTADSEGTDICSWIGITMLRKLVKKKEKKKHKSPRARQQRDFRYYWSKHWELIIAAIAAIIVGLLIVPMFFR